MPKETVGYIKISKFSATTFNEFKEAADKLLIQGMKHLILDLRGNTGGYLQAAINISDEFLEKDKLIVFTEGQNQPRESFYATGKGSLEHIGLTVLIDGGSASASEIVAGALQDNDRGTIIGRRSFGKGLVQRQLDLMDGSALRLTIARYYTPTGRCIQKPYDRKSGFDEYYAESHNRYFNGEMEEEDSIPFIDTLRYMTPGGKIVYGGGGIMPDVFVPLNSDKNLDFYYDLIQKGLIFTFAFEYTDTHRNDLLKYANFEEFNKQFKISTVLFTDFIKFAQKSGLKENSEEINYAEDRIKILMKAYIGRNLFDNEGFYPIFLQIDEVFNEALKQIS